MGNGEGEEKTGRSIKRASNQLETHYSFNEQEGLLMYFRDSKSSRIRERRSYCQRDNH